MRKNIKFVIVSTLMVFMSVSIFCACSHSPEDNNAMPNNDIKHYEVELTKDNFDEFLDLNVTTVLVNPSTYEKDNFCEIKGVLNYAYYKNVTVSFHVEYTRSAGIVDDNIYTGDFSVKLNAAGNYTFYTKDDAVLNTVNNGTITTLTNKSITVTAVSGVVIFDI